MAQHHEIQISKEEIEKLYFEEKKTIKEVAEHFKCHEVTILRKMKKFGIQSRVGGLYTREDLTGKQFSRCKVIKHEFDNSGYSKCICLCNCGKEFEVLPGDLTSKRVKSCGEHRHDHKNGICGELSSHYWNSLVKNAKEREIGWELSPEEAWGLFEKQNKRCALSGEEIRLTSISLKKEGKQTASLDRIDSNKSYTIDNVQWVHKVVNLMKMKLKDDKFIEWCNKISNYQGVKNEQCKTGLEDN